MIRLVVDFPQFVEKGWILADGCQRLILEKTGLNAAVRKIRERIGKGGLTAIPRTDPNTTRPGR